MDFDWAIVVVDRPGDSAKSSPGEDRSGVQFWNLAVLRHPDRQARPHMNQYRADLYDWTIFQ
jgi:hypothetical protein